MGYKVYRTLAETVNKGFSPAVPLYVIDAPVATTPPNTQWILIEGADDRVLRVGETVTLYQLNPAQARIDFATALSATVVGVVDLDGNFDPESLMVRAGRDRFVLTNLPSGTSYTPGATQAPAVAGTVDLLDLATFPGPTSRSNLAPVAVADVGSVIAGGFVELDLLGNDFDPDGDTIQFNGITLAGAGRVTDFGGGRIAYEAPAGFDGIDRFEYRVTDSRGASSTGEILITVDNGIGDGLTVAEARRVAYLYEAGLNRNGTIDAEGLNFWIDQREAGLSAVAVAGAFLASNEFRAAFGDPDALTDRELVELLFRNVLEREGDEGGIQFWTDLLQLEANAITRPELLLAFARSPENIAGSPFVETLVEVAPGFWDFVA